MDGCGVGLWIGCTAEPSQRWCDVGPSARRQGHRRDRSLPPMPPTSRYSRPSTSRPPARASPHHRWDPGHRLGVDTRRPRLLHRRRAARTSDQRGGPARADRPRVAAPRFGAASSPSRAGSAADAARPPHTHRLGIGAALPSARSCGWPAHARDAGDGERVPRRLLLARPRLVVETDGLRYHRTPAQQAKDRRRDQAHAAEGLATLRFAEAQIRHEPEQVQATLAAVAGRLSLSEQIQAGLRPEASRL